MQTVQNVTPNTRQGKLTAKNNKTFKKGKQGEKGDHPMGVFQHLLPKYEAAI